MTYKELYLKEHPECDINKVIREQCPLGDREVCKYEGPIDIACPKCWNRKIPKEKEGFKAKELVPIGEEISKGIEQGISEPNPVIPKEVADGMIAEESSAMKRSDIQKTVEKLQECGFKEAGEAISKATNAMTEMTSIIKDSGTRREFSTGAVRDIQEGKGRCDLMPLDVIGDFISEQDYETDEILWNIFCFQRGGNTSYLFGTLSSFEANHCNDCYTMFLEVAKHFEAGAAKYGEWNWQKGIPTHCYIDSAVRHYLKFLRGDKDEPHDRAFVWNILCCIWTCKHKPELNDYPRREKTDE